MGIDKISEIVRTKLEKSDIADAIQYIESSGVEFSKRQRNQLVLIKSNYSNLTKQSITMLLSEEEKNIREQRVINSILMFIDEISEENENTESMNILVDLLPYIIISLIAGALFALIIFILRS